jgi:pimeloyl-ACP methyl ester carboxylesterase
MKKTLDVISLLALLLSLGLTSCSNKAIEVSPTTELSEKEPSSTTTMEVEKMPASPASPSQPTVEEFRFRSGDFELVGTLYLPAGDGPFPAVIMVHGDGPARRYSAANNGPTIRILQRYGYAVFSWDKPGSGESSGELDQERRVSQRATILADGIKALSELPAIDSSRIGLWGISQAGWVMPLALELSDDITFMIVLSGGAEDGFEQGAYQMGKRVISDGATAEQGALVEQYGPQAYKATSYAAYREAMEILIEIPELHTYYNLEIAEQEEWEPLSRDHEAFFNPMDVIERTTIPILAIFGEFDISIDPVQGAEAYLDACQKAGNQDCQIETLSGRGHVFTNAPPYLEILEAWIQHLSQ